MWIFLNRSFFAVTSHEKNPDLLRIQSRKRGDIEAVFPDALVSQNLSRDYRYQALVGREAVSYALAQEVKAIDYTCFARTLQADALERRDAYYYAWLVLCHWQKIEDEASDANEPGAPPDGPGPDPEDRDYWDEDSDPSAPKNLIKTQGVLVA